MNKTVAAFCVIVLGFTMITYAEDNAHKSPLIRFGFVSDSHYANVDCSESGDGRYFFASLQLMKETVAKFNDLKLDFAVEGGDFTDFSTVDGKDGGQISTEKTLEALDEIEAEFLKFKGPVYHVCGNHDFCLFSPAQFYSRVKNDGKPMTEGYYSFVKNGVKIIVLDANYGPGDRHFSGDWRWKWDDAYVSSDQVAWLRTELSTSKGPCVVICHEILHPDAAAGHLVANAAEIRSILEKSGKVKTVLMGHQHTGMCDMLNGILYYAIPAQVSKGRTVNSFAEVDIFPDGSARITGYGCAPSVEGLSIMLPK